MLLCLPLSKYLVPHSHTRSVTLGLSSTSKPHWLWFLVLKFFVSFPLGKHLLFILCFPKILWVDTRGYFPPFKPGDFEREEEDRPGDLCNRELCMKTHVVETLFFPDIQSQHLKRHTSTFVSSHLSSHSGCSSVTHSCRYLLSWLAKFLSQWNGSHMASPLSSNKSTSLSVAHVAVLLPTQRWKLGQYARRIQMVRELR